MIGPDIRDLSGNAMTAAYTAGVTIDRTPPRLVSAVPGSTATPLTFIDVAFDSPINAATFTAADIQFTGPNGAIGISSITIQPGGAYRVSFGAQNTGGNCTISIGPNIADAAGNLLDQDQDGTGGENPDDIVSATFSLNVSFADMVVDAVSTIQSGALSGDPVQVNWRARNLGNIPATGTWTNRILLSASPTLDNSAVVLGTLNHTGPLAVNGSYDAQATVTLPNGISGDYFIFVITDATNVVFESTFESNNTARTIVPVTVTLKPAPDLQVTGFSPSSAAQPGQKLNVSWVVTNTGPGVARAPWTDRIYRSSTGSLIGATPLAAVTHPVDLASGGTYTGSAQITIPDVADGSYRLIAVTDDGNAVFEGSAENNNATVSLPVVITHPDLAVSITSAPASATSGDSINIGYAVSNVGSGAAGQGGGTWIDRVYLSSDQVIDGADRLLSEVTRTPGANGLSAGG